MGLINWFKKKIGKSSGKAIGGAIGNIVGGSGGKFVGKNVGGLIAENYVEVTDFVKSTKLYQFESIKATIKNSNLNLLKSLSNKKDLKINSRDRFDLIKYSIEYRDKRIVKFLIENSIKVMNQKFDELKKLDKKLKKIEDRHKKTKLWLEKESHKKINQLVNKVFPKLYKKYKLGKENEKDKLFAEIIEKKDIYSKQKIELIDVNFKIITKKEQYFLERNDLISTFNKLKNLNLYISKKLNPIGTPLLL